MACSAELAPMELVESVSRQQVGCKVGCSTLWWLQGQGLHGTCYMPKPLPLLDYCPVGAYSPFIFTSIQWVAVTVQA